MISWSSASCMASTLRGEGTGPGAATLPAVQPPSRARLGTIAIGVLVVLTAVLVVLVFTRSDDDSGGGDATTTTTTRVDVAVELCGPVRTETTGRIVDPALAELSGIATSRRQPGVLWAHNDSGDTARLFALDERGRSLGTWTVTGAQAQDWEDMAIRGGTLYLADIGDNSTARPTVQVYAVPEPEVPEDAADAPAANRATEPATRFELRYPDRAHDAETLLIDPRTGDGFIVTKRVDGTSTVFRFPPLDPAAAPGPITMEPAGSLALGIVTSGDVSPSGDAVVLRTYVDVSVWNRARGQTVAEALATPPCRSGEPIPAEARRQIEAIAFLAEGVGYLTVGEARNAAIERITPSAVQTRG